MISALADSSPKAKVIKADALEADLAELLRELPKPRGVVSNLPYYITGPLLTRIAEAKRSYSMAVLMMQKEVADRVLAEPRTSARGSLSVFLQLQFEIRLLAHAPAGAFMPPPNVDSSVLLLTPRDAPLPKDVEAKLFKMIRLAFQQPRKTLVNNLVAGYKIDREVATFWVESVWLKPTARPQELSNLQWVELFRAKGD
jgi:16S rRNA (adenine1518-N6/adenine1519-N6)-dimethyltransferase